MSNKLLVLQALLDSVNEAILLVQKDFVVAACNKQFEYYFGIPASSIMGKDKREVITNEIKWRTRYPEEFQKKLFWLYDNPEIIAHDEVEVVIPRQVTLHRFSGPVFLKDNKLLGRVEVYYDVTETKKVQSELEKKNEHLFLLTAVSSAINETVELNKLGNNFIRRAAQATSADTGALYIKSGKQLELCAFAGQIEKTKKLPSLISDQPVTPVMWGSVKESIPISPLRDTFMSGYYVCFTAADSKGNVNGLCLLVWEHLNLVWFDQQLLEGVGRQLGLGIQNAILYKEAQRIAILQERDRIAVEMHDGLAQTLGYLGLGLDSLSQRLKEQNPENSRRLLNQLRNVVDRAYKDVREAITGLRVDISHEDDFFQALESYFEEFQRLSNIETKLLLQGDYHTPKPEMQPHIIRIIQESLTNVRRHARASAVDVIFDFRTEGLAILIEDDGHGFDLKEQDNGEMASLHQGIRIMNGRALALGGRLEINTSKGAGTKVQIFLPETNGGGGL